MLLNQAEGFRIHEFLQSHNIPTFSFVLPGRKNLIYFIRHLFFLIRFCRKNNIDLLYSHLEPANFVAALAQFFIRAKVYICRHHIDEGSLYNFDRGLNYRITYLLARHIIVVSEQAKRYMIEKEHISDSKIIHINLAYDFSLYRIPQIEDVNRIRDTYKADVLLVSACRLTKFKRPDVSVQTTRKLLAYGLNVKLLILGGGEMEDSIRKLIDDLKLQHCVYLLGYVENVLDYMQAADFFLHPSQLESSCVVVKEAGFLKRPVVVSRGVGDFDDYLVQETNAFLVDPDRFDEEAAELIRDFHSNKEKLRNMGEALHASVVQLFGVDGILGKYNELNRI